MPVFSLLADPATYNPCSTENMLVDHEYREYWLTHFASHFDSIVRLAIENYGPSTTAGAHACKAELLQLLESLRRNPSHLGGALDLLILDQIRQDLLIKHGIPDPFEKTKARENEAALKLYPQVVADLDSHSSPDEALLLAVEGIFAGNIFDLGAAATTEMFAHTSPDFLAIRKSLDGKRPWLVDHFDAFAARALSRNPYKQAMFFVDNAGPDFLLGVIPFCRLLAQRGTRILLAANDLPALNDMTHEEVKTLLPRIQELDPTFDRLVKQEMILPINSGGTCPLIDLRKVSAEANNHVPGTDLLILEGMGRALESNFEAQFKVDSLKLAMIKEEIVARHHGGKLFDTVCRFDAV